METQTQALARPRYATVSDIIPLPLKAGLVRDAVLVVGFSLLTALCAQISIPLKPVPITFQTLAVLLDGAALGSKRGGASMLLYVAEGAIGLPFYAGGASGFKTLFGATGGYLLGFIVAGYVVGWLAERGWDRNYLKTLVAMLIGSVIIYTLGVAVLWQVAFAGKDLGTALQVGCWQFIPLDAIKTLIAGGVLPGTWFLTRKK